MAAVRISDVIVPRVFAPYLAQQTEEKSRIIEAGAMARNSYLDEQMQNGWLTLDVPQFTPLARSAENISTDDPAAKSVSKKIGTAQDTVVRLSRNDSWSEMALTQVLSGADPLGTISSQLGTFWAIRLQKAVIAMISGINADNGANDAGDYCHEIVSTGFTSGTTSVQVGALVDALQTMGDSKDAVSLMLTHSVVEARMRKNNLITYEEESGKGGPVRRYGNMLVIIDDGMPSSTAVIRKDGSAGALGMYESWFFGPGAIQLGVRTPADAVELSRDATAGTGSGQTTLHNRVEWVIHMPGHRYTGTAANGGPSNAATAQNLNHKDSWNRIVSERKMVPYARLITRES